MPNQVEFYRLEYLYEGKKHLFYRRKDTRYRKTAVNVTPSGVSIYQHEDMTDDEIEAFILVVRGCQKQWRRMYAGSNPQEPLPLSAEPSCVVERRSGSIFARESDLEIVETRPLPDYRLARGCLPWQPGDEPAEDSIRRVRDSEE